MDMAVRDEVETQLALHTQLLQEQALQLAGLRQALDEQLQQREALKRQLVLYASRSRDAAVDAAQARCEALEATLRRHQHDSVMSQQALATLSERFQQVSLQASSLAHGFRLRIRLVIGLAALALVGAIVPMLVSHL